MTKEEINKSLIDLYSIYWEDYFQFIRPIGDEGAAYPFLLAVDNEYSGAMVKVLYCGQETCSWGSAEYDNIGKSPSCPRDIIKVYERFVLSEEGYNSPYWQFYRKVKKTCPDIGLVADNVVKVGKRYSAGCDEAIFQETLKHFDVLRKEIDILNPSFILFPCGYKYDKRIKAQLGPFSKEKIDCSVPKVFRIKFEDPALPPAIQFYHPRYLRMIKCENEVLDIVAKEISSICHK